LDQKETRSEMKPALQYDWSRDSYYSKAHVRLRVIAAALRHLLGGSRSVRILDVGCGAGLLGKALGDAFDYHGCDGSASLFEGRTLRDNRIVHWVCNESHPQLPFGDQPFDAVVCSGFLEYVCDRAAFLKCVRQRLSQDAVFVAGFINFFRLDRRLAFGLRHVGINLRKAYHPLWRNPQTFEDLEKEIRAAGMPVRGVIPLPWRSLGRRDLRLPVLRDEEIPRMSRFPAVFFLSQAVYVCSCRELGWKEPLLYVE
jgi:SAM-dependent methyltransferase